MDDAASASAADLRLMPGEARTVFHIDGMDCGECARTVERVVGKLDGVRELQVNFNTTKMTAVHTAAIPAMIRAVEQVGYRGTVLETTSDAAVPAAASQTASFWDRHKRTILTAVSGVLLGAGFVAEYAGPGGLTAIFLYLLAILTGGFYAARAGLYALRSFTLDMNFLMTVAAVGAALIGEWSEGATVVFLFAVGNWLQAQTMERTRRSIRSLMDLAPKEALVRRQGREERLPLEQIGIGDIVIVRPGERIPMDGTVSSGSSTVNQAPVTGESIPVYKVTGDDVFAGTINETGSFEFHVTKRVEDSTLARMIHLVEEAQAQRAPSQQFVDRFAAVYTPAVVILALLIALIPPLLFAGDWSEWIYRALALLVIACPCALVISTPVSIVAAIGNAARRGVLIKGGAFLEEAGRIRAIAFDKTGTLTVGRPEVVRVEALEGRTERDVLAVAAAVESRSEHPLARAILEAHATHHPGERLQKVEHFQAHAGKGAEAVADGITYRIGKPTWFADMGYTSRWAADRVEAEQRLGRTVMLLAADRAIIGLLSVADVVRPESVEAIRHLRAAGIERTVLLTGDNQRTADAIGAQVGVDTALGELLPEQKLAQIRTLQQQVGPVAMVGDGINDAPALATADIGIAMGGAGTDTALETADLVLMSDDLAQLPFTMRLSRSALRVIQQNIWFSLLVKAVFLLLTVFGLSNLWMAVFADTGTALLVIANGMRLLRAK
ncbi:heavy metal translocating P-type ATPase [Tumebacillus sp. DT12]|uniref:Cd(2+)-exporting ATPase n=1 Tax=Tumebacillus lacus TaxID=2995335 RepID=A0ABT3X226_9BACL|nr:heavy metal translocating P-type ATPase [Tumebacillus lacus]